LSFQLLRQDNYGVPWISSCHYLPLYYSISELGSSTGEYIEMPYGNMLSRSQSI
jgi:hypothetical protein